MNEDKKVIGYTNLFGKVYAIVGTKKGIIVEETQAISTEDI